MDIKSLRYFLQVAETLNFNRAAERLNISQPVVTRVIAQLEHEVGSKLFERTTRRVALTPAGAVLLREVRPLIAHVEAVQQTIRHSVAEKSGRFTVGYTTLAMQTVTPDLLRKFKSEFPDIELEVNEMTSQAQVEALLSAEIDVGFVLTPVIDEALTITPLHRERLKLAVPDYHPHASGAGEGNRVPLSAFANDYFIIPSKQQFPAVYDEIIRACDGAGFRPRLKECGENQTCVGLARAGLGVVFVSGRTTDIPSEGLVFVEIDDPAPVMEIAVAWRTRDPSPLLALFKQNTLGDLKVDIK
ncbi:MULTISPECIES: LysR family transcriptional regulator [Enterobacter cloacae complex]|uniref:LysR family transcriptional regulator n=1 Tax=Enterobacter cloacae complex TaxID=354276 RepID=UPI00079413A5|nr:MULTISPECIES: LysR family transcriptional regulator [Enterobacter cloacae complex]MCK6967446.1 LysR family transcriptional regulator [Enterobacter kobei]CZY43232.1 LysR family transcriptional regulator [Enterobacter hormaechei]CZY79905.1 LysR family transcriptional regulator [Enterobacter hormaechei]CZY80466.1 LysR family transcriptional regulator [Enterobacter hormaechei]SAF26565.1 LysR family transcriptional regulator [Enterobacter hormaechei]